MSSKGIGPTEPDASTAAVHECACGDNAKAREELLCAALDGLSISVVLFDEDFDPVWSNAASEKFFGAPMDAVAGEVFMPEEDPKWRFFDEHGDHYDFMPDWVRCRETRTPIGPKLVGFRSPGGEMLWANSEVIPVPACHCDARWRVVAFLTDLTEKRFGEETLQRLAFSDALTGLANRVALNDRLEQAFFRAKRTGTHSALFFIDLDGFKRINDELGHGAGDKILRVVAERLTSVIRLEDTVARIGGDEFVVLNADQSDGTTPVARVREALEEPAAIVVDGSDRQVGIAVSIGMVKSSDFTTPSELLEAADAAMYKDKRRRKVAGSASCSVFG